MKSLFFVFLVLTGLSSLSKGNSIDDILHTGIATEVLLEFSHGGRLHKVFPHVDNKIYNTPESFHLMRFYVTPLLDVQLDSIQYRLLTNKPKVYSIAFQLSIYDDWLLKEAKIKVKDHYKGKYEVQQHQIAPYIMPQIGLILREPEDPIKSKISIPHRLYPQISQSKKIWFELHAKSERIAKNYVADMKKVPQLIFRSFVLKFRTMVGTTAVKRIKVEVDAFKRTKLMAKIKNQLKKNIFYISSDDMNNLVDQTSRAVRASEYTDNNYIDNNDFISLKEIIKSTLTREVATFKTFNDHRWKSTFWRKEWLKPDKTSTFLHNNVIFNNKTNNVYYFNTSGVDKFTQDEQTRSDMKKVGTNVSTEATVWKVGVTAGAGHSLNKTAVKAWLKANNNSKFRLANGSDLNQLLTAKHSHLQISGSFLKQRPLKLYRLNTQKVHLTSMFDLSSIQVKQTDLEGKMELNIEREQSRFKTMKAENFNVQSQDIPTTSTVNKWKTNKVQLSFFFHAQVDSDLQHSLVYVRTYVRYCNDSYGLCLPIWKDEKREDVYYYFPLLKVDTSLIKVECTTNSGCFINFPIIFFDDCYLIRVANFLTRIQKSIVRVKNLQMYPMNKVQLIWAGDPVLTDIRLPKLIYLTGNVKAVRHFILGADSEAAANRFVKLMQAHPLSLTYIQLQYDVIAQKTSTKTITVNFGKLSKTDFMTSLTNKMGQNKSEYYINSIDYSKLCHEVSQKVVATQLADGTFNMSSKDQINLSQILEDYIQDKTKVADDDNNKQIWKSVFWQDDWTKPDTLKTFLKNFTVEGAGNKQRFRVSNDNVHAYDLRNKADGKFTEAITSASAGGKIPGILETSINVEHSKETGKEKNRTHTTADNKSIYLSRDQLETFLDQNGNYLKWTGTKFTIKPLILHRINKGQIDRNETFRVTLKHGESFGIKSTLSLNSLTTDMNKRCSEKPLELKILITGGKVKSDRVGLTLMESYFPKRPKQGKLAYHMLVKRYGHISETLKNGNVIIAGGRRDQNLFCHCEDFFSSPYIVESEIVTALERNNEKSGNIRQVRVHAASAVVDDIVFMCGGVTDCCCCGANKYHLIANAECAHDGSCNHGKIDFFSPSLRSCERYRDGQWKFVSEMIYTRKRFAMVALKGQIYAIGGITLTVYGIEPWKKYLLNTAEVYNPKRDNWKDIAPMHTKREGAAAAALGSVLYVCGGSYESDTGIKYFDVIVSTCEKYDPIYNSWMTDISRMNDKRQYHTLLSWESSYLFAIGGDYSETVEMYDVKTKKWVYIHPLRQKRKYASAAVIG